MREVSVTIVNRKGNDMSNFKISFESISELIEKIDKATDETEYRKVHVTLNDTDVFTSEELDELEKNDIFY